MRHFQKQKLKNNELKLLFNRVGHTGEKPRHFIRGFVEREGERGVDGLTFEIGPNN
ncbi:MAG TPA: hypothetical protein VEY51_04865 [Chondromyces sp.]|nr:hypothetical protein [Chondromyces sp.]